jgi:LacI family gluconate utilization system Gnt-I transcriptional repressor
MTSSSEKQALPVSRSAATPSHRKASKGETSAKTHLSSRSSGSVTLSDVARLAGVSPITVSRVLNRPELVMPDTIEVVREAIKSHDECPI